MRCNQENCLDNFGRKITIQIHRPEKTVVYVRRPDLSISSRYRAAVSVMQGESQE